MKHLVQIIIIISVLLSGCVTQHPVKTDGESTPAMTTESTTATTATTAVTATTAPIATMSDTAVLDYVGDVLELSRDILDAAVTAESLASMINKVWYNTIYEKGDATTNPYTKMSNGNFYKNFDDAIRAYSESKEYREGAAKINDKQSAFVVSVRQLRDYPSGCQFLYDALVEFHAVCDELMEMAVSPSGSLKTYSDKYNSIQDRFTIAWRDLDAEIKLLEENNYQVR